MRANQRGGTNILRVRAILLFIGLVLAPLTTLGITGPYSGVCGHYTRDLGKGSPQEMAARSRVAGAKLRSIRDQVLLAVGSWGDPSLKPMGRVVPDELPDDNRGPPKYYAVKTSFNLFVKVAFQGFLIDGRARVSLPEGSKIYGIEPNDLWLLPESPVYKRNVPIGSDSRNFPSQLRVDRANESSRNFFAHIKDRNGNYIDAGTAVVDWNSNSKDLFFERVNVPEILQGFRISSALTQKALSAFPAVTTSAHLEGTNLRVFIKYWRLGFSEEFCVRQTPMFKAWEQSDFSRILSIEVKKTYVEVKVGKNEVPN